MTSETFCHIYFSGLTFVIYIILEISIIWCLYQYIKEHQTNQLSSGNKGLYRIGLVYLVFIAATFMVFILSSATICHTKSIPNVVLVLNYLQTAGYTFQFMILVYFLFYRLKTIFHNTAFSLSKRTVIAFTVLYITTWTNGTIAMVSYLINYGSGLTAALMGLTFLLTIAMIVILIYLFIYKLMKVSKSMKDDNVSKLFPTITRAFLLTLISVLSTVLSATFMVVQPFISDPMSYHSQFVQAIVVVNDAYTNFLSVILGYKWFTRYYVKLCGCCDLKFHAMFVRIVAPNKLSKS
eukprot:883830_1